jgi:hypothetical protein
MGKVVFSEFFFSIRLHLIHITFLACFKCYGESCFFIIRVHLNRWFCLNMFYVFLFNSALSARHPLCRGMLGSNPGLLGLGTLVLADRRSNHSARYHPQLGLISSTNRLDLIHSWLDLIHAWLDLIHALLDLIHNSARSFQRLG